MSEKNKKIKEDSSNSGEVRASSKSSASKVVKMRNRFFFMLYRYSSLVFITSLGCMICSLLFLIIFLRQPIPPQYIPINEDGTYVKLEPLSQCKEDAEVKKFMLSAIKKMYKYDYINYSEQLLDAIPYFTMPGWDEYFTEYSRSKTLFAVKENKWIVTVQPNSVPIIMKKDIIDGVCTYEAKTDIQVSYIGSNGQSQKGDMHMRIVRASVINNPDGLGISRAVFVEAKNN